MAENPYESPEADVEQNNKLDVPASIAKKIKYGWVACLVSAVMTLGLMIAALSVKELSNLADIWTSIDVILILGLAYGIYKKSRIASTSMFLYFLASKIWIIVETEKTNGLLVALIFLYFYLQAMIGTYEYHKLVKKISENK